MAIVVLSPGILTSVQDGGRYGYQQYGVSPSGPMDSRALATANLLVGNDPAEAGLEMTLMGAELKFTDAALIALTGADMGASLSGVKADRYRALQVKTGDVLKLGFALSGCRGYLAVRGGIDVKKVMGSRSTMIGKNFGGFEGRKLMKGDVLKIRPAEGDLPHTQTRFTAPDPIPAGVKTLRVIMGPQEERFTEEGIRTFLNSEYTVGQDFDRQGYRLEGEKIAHKTDSNIISDGVVTGSIQVPGTGLPIVMTAERATVGGYTKIATVITADLPVIGQCRAGDRVRFAAISAEQAQDLLREEAKRLESLKRMFDDPSHLPVKSAAPEASHTEASSGAVNGGQAAPAAGAQAERAYEYTKDVTLRVNGKSYAVTIRKWKE